ncbi:hypothetical protein V6C45_16020 [Paenibacillus barengoltzii]
MNCKSAVDPVENAAKIHFNCKSALHFGRFCGKQPIYRKKTALLQLRADLGENRGKITALLQSRSTRLIQKISRDDLGARPTRD